MKTSFFKKYGIFLVVLLVVIIATGIAYRRGFFTKEAVQPSPGQNTANTETHGPSQGQGAAGTSNQAYRGEPVGIMREGKLGDGFPEAYKARLRAELLDLAKKVAVGDAGFDDWMRIGVIKKVFMDYRGAADAFEYAGSIYTINALPFYNLGDLYGWYMKEPVKAEANFQHAIKLDPKKANFYTSLADLYRLFYTEKKDQIAPTIESGLKALPNDMALLMYLGSYYRDDVKDNTKAVFYYEKVLAQDPSNSNLKDEIVRLKSAQ